MRRSLFAVELIFAPFFRVEHDLSDACSEWSECVVSY